MRYLMTMECINNVSDVVLQLLLRCVTTQWSCRRVGGTAVGLCKCCCK